MKLGVTSTLALNTDEGATIYMKYNFELNLDDNNNSTTLIIKQVQPNTNVLEFGPANGRITKYLNLTLNCKVYIIEIDEEAGKDAAKYAENYLFDDIENYLWLEKYREIKFDYIIFSDVLEHLKNPKKVLLMSKMLLAQNGSIIFSIPNIGHNAVLIDLANSKFEYKELGILDNTHIKFFAYDSIEKMLHDTLLYPVKRMATYVKACNTEFFNDYTSVKGIDPIFWKTRKYGDIYQYVYEVKQCKELIDEEYNFIADIPKEYYAEVFFDYGKGYNPEQVLTKYVDISVEHIILTFSISMIESAKNIRFDPINTNCIIKVNKASVIYNETFIDLKIISSNADFVMDDTYYFSINDPQIYFEELETEYQKIYFDITFEKVDSFTIEYIIRKLGELSKKYFLETNKEINSLHEKIHFIENYYEKLIQTKESEIKEKEAKMQEREIEIKAKCDEIVNKDIIINKKDNEILQKNNMINMFLNSKSWRITKPLRMIRTMLKKNENDEFLKTFNKDKMNINKIHYSIDSCSFDKNSNMYHITGWVFSEMENIVKIESAHEIIELNNNIYRYDVYNAYEKKHKSSLKSGFFIIIKSRSKCNFLNLIFLTNDNKINYQINVKEVNNSKKHYVRVLKLLFNRTYLKRGLYYLKQNGIKNFTSKFITVVKYKILQEVKHGYNAHLAYLKWIESNETYNANKVSQDIIEFKHKPLISIIMPVYNVKKRWLVKCIESVINQYYENWELCIADDCSTFKYVRTIIDEYKKKDVRIKAIYRSENGHISKASNSALSIALGEYVTFLDNDDELTPHALYEVVKLINNHPEAEIIYSDEDKIDTAGNRMDPHFKPEWSPDTIFSCNYITHLCVIKKQIVDSIGGFRIGYEGSQDYDLILRASEVTNRIFHISKILYHWRMINGSTAIGINHKNYAYIAAKNVLESALQRRNEKAEVNELTNISMFHVSYYPKEYDLISIIIPTRDKPDILKRCLKSIYEKTNYKNYEVIIINNGSIEKDTYDLFQEYNYKKNFFVYDVDIPFNYSKINNIAARRAKGNLLLFLNNDVEVISENWLDEMAGQASRVSIGAVGVKLLYPNNTVQHCGIVMGLGGVCANTYTGASNDDVGYIGRLRVVYNYSAVTAACLMVKKDIFFEVDGFTEELAVAYNDVDLCLKILDRGYYNICIPKIELYHHESASRGKDTTLENSERFYREQEYLKNKWAKYIKVDPFYSTNLTLDNAHFYIR